MANLHIQIMKGISPLIATVLLVVIVVAIGTMVMTWSSTFTTSTTRNVQNRSDTAFNCASANIIIEDVYLVNGSLATVRAIVKNIGVVDVLISAAQAYNTTGGNLVTLQFSNVSMTKCSDFSKVVVSTS